MSNCDFNRYVGLPFKDKGRDVAGLDCWGLVCLVYAEQASIELPSYTDEYKTAADDKAISDLVAGYADPWREISERDTQPLDCVLMLLGGREAHIGLVVKRGLVLHVSPGSRSLIEPYGSTRLRKRVSRFMRHRER